MNSETVQKILSDLESGYDLIADKFSSTRAFMWRDLEFIKEYAKPGDKILDFGCGNGRLAEFLKGKYSEYTGVDISQKLIDIAKQRYNNEKTEFIKIEHTPSAQFNRVNPQEIRLPFKDNYFDAVFSIAVFHHLPGKEYRLEVAKELHRVLKPGGKIFISVWNLWQRRFWKYHALACRNKISRKSELDWGDIYIPFKTGENVFQRYHHTFSKSGLISLFKNAGFCKNDLKIAKNIVYIGSK